MTGGVLSTLLTVTVKEHVDVLPVLSLAVHVTVVVPTAKQAPLATLHVTVGLGSQLSVALGITKVAAAHVAVLLQSISTTILAGQVITGGLLSGF